MEITLTSTFESFVVEDITVKTEAISALLAPIEGAKFTGLDETHSNIMSLGAFSGSIHPILSIGIFLQIGFSQSLYSYIIRVEV